MTTNLPSVDVSSARLPASYEQAKTALATCLSIDECHAWADKAIAMASYAKQAQDDTLSKYATRIKARAIRRCGELLKSIPASKGGDPSLFARGDAPTSVTRSQAAEDAGMSRDQKVTALRVASVDQADFDEQVESDFPPTITALAEQGRKTAVDLGDITAADYKTATRVMGALREFAKFCGSTDPASSVRGFKPHEIENLRQFVAVADAWLDVFSVHL